MDLFCLYCLDDDASRMSKEHIFPQCIGGRFWIDNCCKSCNNLIGRTWDNEAKDAPILASGISHLGLQPPEQALGQLKKIDSETGERLHLDGDKLFGSFKILNPRKRKGPPKQLRRSAIEDVRKRFPDYAAWYAEEIRKGSQEISLPGEVHEFREEQKRSTVEFTGKTGFPIALIAKIAYESMFAAGLFTVDSISEFYRTTFEVYKAGSKTTEIAVSSSFRKRLRPLYPDIWRWTTDYSTLSFKPSHSLDFRITDKGIAYIRVNFFEIVSFMVVVSEVNREDVPVKDLLEKRCSFPIEGPKCVCEQLPDCLQSFRQADDVFAKIVWDVYCGRDPLIGKPT